MLCSCGTQIEFDACCGPLIKGERQASTAEELMRARYTAYDKKEMDFIEKSHDPKNRKSLDMKANAEWANRTHWLGLEVLSTEAGGPEDEKGYVEFKAKFKAGDGEQIHHELSEFNKRDGRWYFTDSKNPEAQTVVRTEEKVGRNDPCPCGSGKKYKKCCGAS